jgi:hypothetical protein
MQAPPSPALVALLQGLRQQALHDAGRDIAIVHAWRPGVDPAHEGSDWRFVALQVLTVAELWSPPGS